MSTETSADPRGMPGNEHGRYLRALALMLGCAALCVFFLNWIVDPLGLGSLLGRDVFPMDYRFEREVRYNTLTARHPDVLILGSSETGHGIDPANALLGGRTVYNAAISGGTSGELVVLMRHVAAIGSVRRVLFGISYLMTKESVGAGFNDAFLASPGPAGWLKAAKARLSTTMLVASLKEIAEKRSQKAGYADGNGHLLPVRFQAELRGHGGPYGAMSNSIETTARRLVKDRSNFAGDLREIIDMACENNIELTIFTPPSHVYMLEMLRDLGMIDDLDDWERLVARTVSAARCPVTFWDFTGVNAVTTEAIPPPGKAEMEHYWDMQHYRVPLGNEMVAEMFAGPARPPLDPDLRALGERVTPDNIAAFQSEREAALRAYEASHPRDVARIQTETAKAVPTAPRRQIADNAS